MAFVIPTIYTAVDRMTSVQRRIAAGNNAISDSAKFAANGVMSMAKSAALVGGTLFAGKSIMDFESELANLKALTGASGEQFLQFKSTIEQVANSTKKSSVEVAQGFTTIANAMPQLLDSADGLGKVTEASILLAKAARMELTPAAESVTTILNAFNKGADEAAKLVNLMGAGSKYGSAEISDLGASMTEFAAQARLAGVQMNESIALVELVSKFRKGTQAGIELRNVLIEMSKGLAQDPKAKADMRRLGVNIQLVANSAIPLTQRLQELKKVAGDSNALFHIFGKENQAMAATILQNVDALPQLLNSLNETGVTAKMAAENTNTLANRFIELKNKFVTFITTADTSSFALNSLRGTIGFITNHLNGLLNITLLIAGAFYSYKTVVWALNTALKVNNIISAISMAVTKKYCLVTLTTTEAITAFNIATKFLSLSLAMQIGIVGGIALALGGLIALFVKSDDNLSGLNSTLDESNNKFKAIKKPIDDATIALQMYNKEVDRVNNRNEVIARKNFEIKDRFKTQEAIYNIQSGRGKEFPLGSPVLDTIPLLQGPTKERFHLSDNQFETDSTSLVKDRVSYNKTQVHKFELTIKDGQGNTIKTLTPSDMMPSTSSTATA